MNWLAVETSALTGSLSFFANKKMLGTRQWTRMGSHSELLTAAAEELSRECGVPLNTMKRIAVGIGPGSFTGIRAGVNFARTFAYALNIPVFSLNSLYLLAHQSGLPTQNPVRIVQYAFRDLVYTAEYRLDQGRIFESIPPYAITVSELEKQITNFCLVLGTGFELLKNQFKPSSLQNLLRKSELRDFPLSEDFINTSVLDQSSAHLTDWIHTIPLYVRASEAEEKLKAGALKPL